MEKIDLLRKKYPRFVYKDFHYKIKNGNLKIVFDFFIWPDICFQPEILIKNIDKKRFGEIPKEILDNLIFHLGLIEIPSYWKTTLAPKIDIKAGYLNDEQKKWWRDLIINGMGQFFYENKIDWRKPDFLKIISSGKKLSKPYLNKLHDWYLVPFAGGRDSIVTLENLKKQGKDIFLFTVNPIEKIQETVKVSGIKNQIMIERKIDKTLLNLNKKGYLNGHTPFTSLLSFLSVFCAVLFDYKNIAFSNEKSANEGNVEYFGKIINHQWAKSSEFEKMFKIYCKKYLARDINYFSFLRKKTDLEISKIFIKYPRYFPVFSSCNAGMKIGAKGNFGAKKRWCGKCPKCLFVYLTLYPFLGKKELFKIFGKDIFEDKKLLPLMKALLGMAKIKPFECVGTRKESKKAFQLSLKKSEKIGKAPYILTKLDSPI